MICKKYVLNSFDEKITTNKARFDGLRIWENLKFGTGEILFTLHVKGKAPGVPRRFMKSLHHKIISTDTCFVLIGLISVAQKEI